MYIHLKIISKFIKNLYDKTYFSLSPTYFDIKSLDEMLKKVPEASVAQAFARQVFPVPGGPYKRIPDQGFLTPSKS